MTDNPLRALVEKVSEAVGFAPQDVREPAVLALAALREAALAAPAHGTPPGNAALVALADRFTRYAAECKAHELEDAYGVWDAAARHVREATHPQAQEAGREWPAADRLAEAMTQPFVDKAAEMLAAQQETVALCLYGAGNRHCIRPKGHAGNCNSESDSDQQESSDADQ